MITIKSGNILIASFMNGVKTDKGDGIWRLQIKNNKKPYLVSELRFKYHKDWNWIIPACRKFDCLFEGLPESPPHYIHCSDMLDHNITLYELKGVWEQLVQNIVWYNKYKTEL